jgi:hypothetical protein
LGRQLFEDFPRPSREDLEYSVGENDDRRVTRHFAESRQDIQALADHVGDDWIFVNPSHDGGMAEDGFSQVFTRGMTESLDQVAFKTAYAMGLLYF